MTTGPTDLPSVTAYVPSRAGDPGDPAGLHDHRVLRHDRGRGRPLLIAGQIDSSGLDERTSWQLAHAWSSRHIISRGLAKIGSQREYYDLR